MSIIEIFIISIGLAMDAFAVSICKGLSTKKFEIKNAMICGAYFGLFQALMPVIGYVLGVQFKEYIERIDHWVAFVLLILIGINMIRESFSTEEECDTDFSWHRMIPLAIATSIDALAIGVTFAFLEVQIIPAASIIGIVTFVIAILGVKIGNIFGNKYKSKAECTGGIILIVMGIKILVEHLGILPF